MVKSPARRRTPVATPFPLFVIEDEPDELEPEVDADADGEDEDEDEVA
jgi:hypothetical protein